MKKIVALILLLMLNCTFGQNTQEKYHRAKIFYSSSQQLQDLLNAGIEIDHGFHKKNVYFESDFSESDLQLAKQLGRTVTIEIENVKAFYLNQNKPSHESYVSQRAARNASCLNGSTDYQTPSNFNVFPANQFGGFYTYSQLLQELDDMATLYPNLITAPADIGPNGNPFVTEGTADNSTSPSIGGNTIKWVKISDNPNTSSEGEPQILYNAIHHAREPASLSQLVFYMWYLLENYDSDPEVQSIVNNTELFFVPVLNPDGYLYNEKTDPQGGGFWRKNRKNSHGVDNNRNYEYYINGNSNNGVWGGPGSSSNTGSEVYHGSGPFSEVENQAMKWFVEQHNFVMALNNHTFGQVIFYPFGYADVATPDDDLYEQFTDELVSQNGYNPLRDSPYAGDSDDFMYGTVGTHNKIFAMTPEIGTSFWPSQSSIESICKDMMYFNLTAANMVSNFATLNSTTSQFIETTIFDASYSIKRLGLEEPANFTIRVNPLSSNIISVGSPNNHSNLTYGQEISDIITVNLDPNTNEGDLIEFELIINNGAFDKSVTVSSIFGLPTTIFNEVGDDTATNWTTADWDSTSEDFVSASNSITDSPNSDYSDNENSTITLGNPIDLVGAIAASVNFYAKWDIEAGFDYVQFEVSINNGSSWIPQCGDHTRDGGSNHAGANGEPLYDGTQNSWVLETINLSDYIGEEILIRFQLVSDVAVNEDGFYFDDLSIDILRDNLSVTDVLKTNVKIYPNPVTDILNINTTLANFDVAIFDINGQLLLKRDLNSGNVLIDYSNFSSGIYFLQITTLEESQAFKIVKQ